MMVIWNASDVTLYDESRPELSNATLHMKQDTSSIKKIAYILNSNLDLPVGISTSEIRSWGISHRCISKPLKEGRSV